MDLINSIEGEKGLFKISPIYIYNEFLTLENKVICLDHNNNIKEVRRYEDCKNTNNM